MDPSQEVRSLKRALRALTVLNQKGDATVTQVAEAIGVPRTTSYRLLETLAVEGYIERLPNCDYYRLTSLVQQLSSGFQQENLLVEVATPLIAELGRRVGWPVSLSTPRATDMVTRLTTNYDTSLALERYMVGFVTPMMHATAGFCYLAHCPDVERERLINICRQSNDPLQAMARNETRLAYVLERVRTRGFSHLEFPQYREGNVGVPVISQNRPLGGIVMRYIKSALKGPQIERDFVPVLRDSAQDIAVAYTARAAEGWEAGLKR